ncbi:hypothetical protein Ahy_A07g031758 [Arachis hypogaea]|uniref:Uncharacterized protein n=1 Tax=Arachis hypogaea TaxID=3818 RepID=A0A445C4X0_ARAHY|nr:hypothetical protein Ahy_A07g031758 [Arachis hypogaea]
MVSNFNIIVEIIEEAQRVINSAHVEAENTENCIGVVKWQYVVKLVLNLRSKYQLQSSSTFWQRNSTISKIFVKECMEPTCTKVMTGTALIRSNVGLVT